MRRFDIYHVSFKGAIECISSDFIVMEFEATTVLMTCGDGWEEGVLVCVCVCVCVCVYMCLRA